MAEKPKKATTEQVKPEEASAKAPVKKPKRGIVGGTVATVKTWVSWDAVSRESSYVAGNFRSLLKVEKPTHTESYEEALKRLNLTEADMAQKKKDFMRLTLIMGALGVLVLCYTLYLLWNASFGSGALALVVSLLCFATACRYHFWYFQIKNHKLGCTIHEWLNAKVSGGE
ncbi:MAG: hypothetical protein HKM04_08285 [Legionellales bacterium]|nr:hypothetical protein [Legionellales bacterium]